MKRKEKGGKRVRRASALIASVLPFVRRKRKKKEKI